MDPAERLIDGPVFLPSVKVVRLTGEISPTVECRKFRGLHGSVDGRTIPNEAVMLDLYPSLHSHEETLTQYLSLGGHSTQSSSGQPYSVSRIL